MFTHSIKSDNKLDIREINGSFRVWLVFNNIVFLSPLVNQDTKGLGHCSLKGTLW